MRVALIVLPFVALLTGCGSDAVESEEDAKRAYEGLDDSIDKAITLGFDGFNAASSANIDPQTASGSETGTLTVSGQVDQGASDNKTMNLTEELEEYSDDGVLTYDTGGTLPLLSMKLSMIPTGTLDGTLEGDFEMTGELEGTVHLSIAFAGQLQPSAADPDKVERKPGTTHITGSASSGDASYQIDVTR